MSDELSFLNKPEADTTAGATSKFRPAVILPDGSRAMQLGSGTIASMLGMGGMANIYRIWNPQLEQHRAVKLMHPNLSLDSRLHFQTEMKIMAGLDHPNIVEIHSVGTWNDLPYIEMEYIDGPTLDAMIKDRGALPLTLCTAIAVFVARALAYAHTKEYLIYGQHYRGIIHRDLKPSNVMLSSSGVVKLMDFGIARPVEASLFTTDGAIMGTMQYLAPEQLDGKAAHLSSDVYSFGAVLYEMLTGVKAFPQAAMSKLMASKTKNDFRPLESYHLKIPRALHKLVARCMTLDARRRPQNAEAVRMLVERVHRAISADSPEVVIKQYLAAGESGRTVLRTHWHVRQRHIVAATGGLLVGALAGWGVWWFASRPAPQPKVVVVTREIPAPVPVTPAVPATPRVRDVRPAPVTPPLAAKAAPASPAASEPTLLVRLAQKHGTTDAVELLVREVEAGDNAVARQVYGSLSAAQKQTPRATVFGLRAMRALGDNTALRALLDGSTVADGEIALARAQMAYDGTRYGEALRLQEEALRTPAQFAASATLRRDALYLRARSLSKQFDAAPSQAAYSAAMDAWYEAKMTVRDNPQHPHFAAAVAEMQRLTQAKK